MPRPRRRPSRASDTPPVPPAESTSASPESGTPPGPDSDVSLPAPVPVETPAPEAVDAPAPEASPESAPDAAPVPVPVPAPARGSEPEPEPMPAPESAAAPDSLPAEALSAEILPVATDPVPNPNPVPAPAGPLQLKSILEALLFSAQKALTPRELRDFLVAAAQDETAPEAAPFKKAKEIDIEAALRELQQEHEAAGRTYRLLCVAGSWQFASVPEFAPWLRALLGRKSRPPRLSQPGIETLTIIAYRQPVTRAEIEQIRGVNIDGVMQTLLERGLVVAVGRAEVVGRPVTYGTTPQFLEYFGIRALEDLPAADELRRIPVQRPEALLTVDPNLATAPADAPSAPAEVPSSDPANPAPAPSEPPPAATAG